MIPVHALHHIYLKSFILTLSTYLRPDHPIVLLIFRFPSKPFRILHFYYPPPTCHVPQLLRPPSFDHPKHPVRSTNRDICFVCLLLLLFDASISPNLRSSLRVRDQFFHPCKIRIHRKIIILYVSNFLSETAVWKKKYSGLNACIIS